MAPVYGIKPLMTSLRLAYIAAYYLEQKAECKKVRATPVLLYHCIPSHLILKADLCTKTVIFIFQLDVGMRAANEQKSERLSQLYLFAASHVWPDLQDPCSSFSVVSEFFVNFILKRDDITQD